jgi:hypothetical protein
MTTHWSLEAWMSPSKKNNRFRQTSWPKGNDMTCLYCDNTGKYVLPYKGDIGEPCTRCPAGDLAKIREAWEKYSRTNSSQNRYKATDLKELLNFIQTCNEVFGWECQEPPQGEKTEQEHGG